MSNNRNHHILRDLEPTDEDHDSLYGLGPGFQSPSNLTTPTPSKSRNVVNISPFKKREMLRVIAQNKLGVWLLSAMLLMVHWITN